MNQLFITDYYKIICFFLVRCNKLSVVGNRKSTTERTNIRLKYLASLKSLKGMVEKVEHNSSQRHTVKEQEAMSQIAAMEISAAYQEKLFHNENG